MKKQIHIFLTAVMFYTRIPCPSWVDHSEELLNKATIYFPFIGWIMAVVAVLPLWLLSPYLPASVCLLLSMIATIWVTGAFHEDGFADVCDGFGGGWTRERILEIMKDSRLGTYGVVGLGLILSLKYMTLFPQGKMQLFIDTALLLLVAHPLSRWTAVLMIYTMPYARANDDDGKAKPVAKQLEWYEFLVATIFGFLPLLSVVMWTQNYYLLLIAPALFLLKWRLQYYFQKWIQGYTGDCLGATQQLAEVLIYLVYLLFSH